MKICNKMEPQEVLDKLKIETEDKLGFLMFPIPVTISQRAAEAGSRKLGKVLCK